MRSSDTEVRAITIERNADDCYKAEYMQQHLGEIFDGIIAGVTDFGFYVALPNTVEGLVHVSTLPESDWHVTVWATPCGYSARKSMSTAAT